MKKYHATHLIRIIIIVSIYFFPFFIINAASAEEELTYSMTRGDNLWNITEKYLTDGFRHWNSLLHLNQVAAPNNMPIGTNLRIPLRWLKVNPAAVLVYETSGNVQYLEAGKTDFRTLTSETVLKAGDKVIVADGANVVLEFSDKSRLLLGSNSEMELVKINKFSDSGLSDTTVKLKKGRTETKVKTKNSRFQIKTPSANTSVRGTEFRVSIDKKTPDLSRVEVLQGSVRTVNSKGNRLLTKGFGAQIKKNKLPTLPVQLLSKPQILKPSHYSRMLPIDFEWSEVEGAEKYRIQIYKTTEKQTLIIDKTIPLQRFSSSMLEDGDYAIKVRAIDSNGLEGFNTDYSLQLDASPQPPLPITPKPDEAVRLNVPLFEWSTPAGSTGYHFLLSENFDLSSPLFNTTNLTESRFTPEQLSPGKYYWTIATFVDAKEGPLGQVQSFTLKPAPKAPDLSKMSAGEDEKELMLRWERRSEKQHFRIQIATDSKFKDILFDQQLENPEFTAARPFQIIYLRIKVIENDGFEGDWSPVQKIEPLPAPWYYFLTPTIPFLTFFLFAL